MSSTFSKYSLQTFSSAPLNFLVGLVAEWIEWHDEDIQGLQKSSLSSGRNPMPLRTRSAEMLKKPMSQEEIAERLVEVLDARAEGSKSGTLTGAHALISPCYIAVRVLDIVVWDTEDENNPPEDGDETFEHALAHAEENVRDYIAGLEALLESDES